jgi:hypothetical protein
MGGSCDHCKQQYFGEENLPKNDTIARMNQQLPRAFYHGFHN